MNKYHNVRTEVDGIKFDSMKEATRYRELKLMERQKLLFDLRRQVPFELIPAERDGSGKVIERALTYRADFVYTTCTGIKVVEDVKGYRTDVYKIKKRLLKDKYGIEIQEV